MGVNAGKLLFRSVGPIPLWGWNYRLIGISGSLTYVAEVSLGFSELFGAPGQGVDR